MYLYLLYILFFFGAYFEVDRFAYFGRIHKILFFIFILILFSLATLRWETGTDWDNYLSYYNAIPSYALGDWYMEYGYSFVNYFVKVVFDKYTILLAILALMLYAAMGITIYRYSVFPILSLAIWVAMSLGDMFFVRNTIAIALAVFSVRYIVERDIMKFLLVILVAMLFHRTALVFLPAYFVYSMKLSRVTLILGIGITLIIGLFFSEMFVSGIGKLLGGAFEEKIKTYVSVGIDATYGSAYSSTTVLLRGAVNRSLILVVLLIWMNKERQEDSLLNGFINFYVLGLLLFFVTVPLSTAMGRIPAYYNVFQMFLFPYILLLSKDRKNQIILYLLIGIYFLVRLHGVIGNYRDAYIPYKSIFDIC